MLSRFDLRAWLAAHPEVKGKPPKIAPQIGRHCEPRSHAEASRSLRRAGGWIRTQPGAVAGQNGHGRTLFVAVILLRGFLLTRAEAGRYWMIGIDPVYRRGTTRRSNTS